MAGEHLANHNRRMEVVILAGAVYGGQCPRPDGFRCGERRECRRVRGVRQVGEYQVITDRVRANSDDCTIGEALQQRPLDQGAFAFSGFQQGQGGEDLVNRVRFGLGEGRAAAARRNRGRSGSISRRLP